MIEQTAKVISPAVMSSAMLVSSTVAETDYPEWNAATSYTLGQKCIRATAHRCYERLAPGTSATAPELDATNWLDIGPTNRWAMFDDVVGTTTADDEEITVSILPGSVSGIALLEVFAVSVAISIKDEPGGSEIYSKTVEIDGTVIASVFDWFYKPLIRDANVIFTDLPFHYSGCEMTISITGPGEVSCGVCKFGEVIGIGEALSGATSGIVDYSTKTADTFGRYSIKKRAYSKRASISVLTEKSDFNRISRALAELRATPAVWITTESVGYEPLTIYGFYKDFSIQVNYATMHFCSIEIEGLI